MQLSGLGNLVQQLITTTTNALLTPPAGSAQIIFAKALVTNNDSASHTVTVYCVPAGGSVGASTITVNAQPFSAGQTAPLPISGKALTQGEALYMKCSASNQATLDLSYLVLS